MPKCLWSGLVPDWAQKDLISDASRLLDLGGLAVDRVEPDGFGGRVVHVVTANETASACPICGVLSVCLKGRVCTPPGQRASAQSEEPVKVLKSRSRPVQHLSWLTIWFQ
jgi:hypothetical protein